MGCGDVSNYRMGKGSLRRDLSQGDCKKGIRKHQEKTLDNTIGNRLAYENMNTLKELTAAGYSYEIKHFRSSQQGQRSNDGLLLPSEIRKRRLTFSPSGGETIIALIHPNKDLGLAIGVSRVHPNDNFCRARGIKIAVEKALSEFRRRETVRVNAAAVVAVRGGTVNV